MRARQSVGKRSQNKTQNEMPTQNVNQIQTGNKTIDLTNIIEQARNDDSLRNYKSLSSSSKNSVQYQGSQSKKLIQKQNSSNGTFPMHPEDVRRHFGTHLS